MVGCAPVGSREVPEPGLELRTFAPAFSRTAIVREQELLQAARHLGIEVYFLEYQDGALSAVNPADLVDISAYKVQKIRAIQSHAGQHPPLTKKAEEKVDKVPCHEYFTVAHTIGKARDLAGCFETGINPTG